MGWLAADSNRSFSLAEGCRECDETADLGASAPGAMLVDNGGWPMGAGCDCCCCCGCGALKPGGGCVAPVVSYGKPMPLPCGIMPGGGPLFITGAPNRALICGCW